MDGSLDSPDPGDSLRFIFTSLHSIFSPENAIFTNHLLSICAGKPVQMKMVGVGILEILSGEGSHL